MFTKKISRYLLRAILILIAVLIYNNYRNNQCINNNKCQPIFISYLLNIDKFFEYPIIVEYVIKDKSLYADIMYDKEFNENYIKKIRQEASEKNNIERFTLHEKLTKNNYGDTLNINHDIIYSSKIIVKKFIIKNTSKFTLKLKPKMETNPEFADSIRIYNCFCNKTIMLEPFKEKELFLYYSVKKEAYGVINISID